MMSEFVLVLSTAADDGSAEELARALVATRVAACVNVLPTMVSVYRWSGELRRDLERQIVIKTTRASLPALERQLLALHPYEVPEFLVIPIDRGSASYVGWLRENVGG
jgi:periplasmic divalent cation tolerance protein